MCKNRRNFYLQIVIINKLHFIIQELCIILALGEEVVIFCLAHSSSWKNVKMERLKKLVLIMYKTCKDKEITMATRNGKKNTINC